MNKLQFGNNLPSVEFLEAVVVGLAISVVAYIFFVTPNQVNGESMIPTLYNQELIFTNKLTNWLGNTDFGKQLGLDYQRGDLIIFQIEGRNSYIKRVIAIGGDTIGIKDGRVYLNNKLIDEKYLPPSIRTSGGTFLQDGDTKVVPADSYFVMGDNREDSRDSRFSEIEFISRQQIRGKVFARYWPLTRIGLIETGNQSYVSND